MEPEKRGGTLGFCHCRIEFSMLVMLKPSFSGFSGKEQVKETKPPAVVVTSVMERLARAKQWRAMYLFTSTGLTRNCNLKSVSCNHTQIRAIQALVCVAKILGESCPNVKKRPERCGAAFSNHAHVVPVVVALLECEQLSVLSFRCHLWSSFQSAKLVMSGWTTGKNGWKSLCWSF